jgi:hypothetical protein
MPKSIVDGVSIRRRRSFPAERLPGAAFASWRLVAAVGVCSALACGGASTGGDDKPGETSEDRPPAGPPRQSANPDPSSSTKPEEPNDPGPACTTILIFGLNVSVENSPVDCADLSVIATSGAYSETLECNGDDTICSCTGAGERTGTYQLSASAGDPPVELAHAGPVTVTGSGCHVKPRSIVLRCAPPEDAGVPPAQDAGVSAPPDAGPSDAG